MAQLSLTFTITMAMFCVGGMIAGFCAKKIKSRWYVVFAAILMLAGFLLTSATSSLGMLYIGFGVFCGIGAGLAYNAVLSTMSAWFPDKQGADFRYPADGIWLKQFPDWQGLCGGDSFRRQ